LVLLAQRPRPVPERNVLQLTDTFAGHAEFLAAFLELLRLPAIEAEEQENNFLLAIIEHVKQAAHFVAQVFVAQKLKWCLCVLIADDFAELSRIIIADRCSE